MEKPHGARATLTSVAALVAVITALAVLWTRQAEVPANISSLETAPQPARLRAIGEYFCRQTLAGTVSSLAGSRDVPDVVLVGASLPGALAALRDELQGGYTVETQAGDALDEKGGLVTHSILIRTAQDGIGLRMRYDSDLGRFHIVGFFSRASGLGPWTAAPGSSPESVRP